MERLFKAYEKYAVSVCGRKNGYITTEEKIKAKKKHNKKKR